MPLRLSFRRTHRMAICGPSPAPAVGQFPIVSSGRAVRFALLRDGLTFSSGRADIAMLVNTIFFAVLALLFLGMVGMQIAGHHYLLRRRENDPVAGSEGTTAVEAALYALLGLMVAFTFSGAEDRLDARRQLIVEEVNAVGTAYLRLDLLLPNDEAELRQEMRQYVDTRLAFYDKILDFSAAKGERRRSDAIQQESGPAP